MKRILLNISLALALGFSISSCNDWLDGVEQKYVEEVGAMKLFGKMKHTWINTLMHSIHIFINTDNLGRLSSQEV